MDHNSINKPTEKPSNNQPEGSSQQFDCVQKSNNGDSKRNKSKRKTGKKPEMPDEIKAEIKKKYKLLKFKKSNPTWENQARYNKQRNYVKKLVNNYKKMFDGRIQPTNKKMPVKRKCAGRQEFSKRARLADPITLKVEVAKHFVGSVVGRGGATIKRIQATTHTNIVTPSKDQEPIFEVSGLPEDVKRATEKIKSIVATMEEISAKKQPVEDQLAIQDFYEIDTNNVLGAGQFGRVYYAKHQKKSVGGESAQRSEDTVPRQNEVIRTNQQTKTIAEICGFQLISNDTTGHNSREVRAFCAFINLNLSDDEDLVKLGIIKLNREGNDLFTKVRDGVLLCKMVNMASPGTIAEKAINKIKLEQGFRRKDNLQLGIMSANSIGVVTVNHTPIIWSDPEKNQHMVLGLIWQLVKKAAFKKINLNDAPIIAALQLPGEKIDDMLGLSPEELLLRWINYHLNKDKANYSGPEVHNFTAIDSQAYICLLNRIQPLELHPQLDYSAQGISDDVTRAQRVQEMAAALGCGDYITAGDITDSNEKVNMLFAAQLFNKYPCLENPDTQQSVLEETLDEKTYRNWMNSLEVKPYVNYLYHALSDGIVILQLEDIIRKGCIDLKRVNQSHLAVKLAPTPWDRVVGKGICDQNKMLTLGIVWKLMRADTLNVISGSPRIRNTAGNNADRSIIKWANHTLGDSSKSRFFINCSDQSLKDSVTILQLVEAIKPGSVDWKCLENGNHLENARYCLSCCRRIGARVYALPEHIVDVNKKMISTIFACLMGIGLSSETASSGDVSIETHRDD